MIRTNKECMPWVIFDLDGTLANINHRLQEIKSGDYNDSMAKILDDELKLDIYLLWKMAFHYGYNISIITARRKAFKYLTENWLEREGIKCDEIHMRNDDDHRSDVDVKQDIFTSHFKNRRVIFAVEDRDSVVKMWRDNGITCLQCQGSDY